MKINVSSILNVPGAKEEFSLIINKLRSAGEVSVIEPIQVNGYVIHTGELLQLKAKVKTAISDTCDRCLDKVCMPVEFELEEYYCHKRDQIDETIDNCGNNEIVLFEGDYIDIAEAIHENIILNLPMRVLCDPECPGICPSCGQNLKEGNCECCAEELDPRLAVLAQLKDKKKE